MKSMNRLDKVKTYVVSILMAQNDYEIRNKGFIHLFGVSSICNLLALKRNLDPEICAVFGILHDIYKYKNASSIDHAHLGSIEARKILSEIDCFTESEIDIICHAIYNHSNKASIDNPYDELLKDADVLQHYLNNVNNPIQSNEIDRTNCLLHEFNIKKP